MAHPTLSERYFLSPFGMVDDPHWVVTKDGNRLACLSAKNEKANLCLVHFHGNAGLASNYQGTFSQRLRAMGLAVVLAEYRGFGQSTGKANLLTMLDDVEDIAYSTGYQAENIIFMGRSAGSIYALEAVWRFPNAAGLVLESAIADMAERIELRVRPDEINCSRELMLAEISKYFNHREKISQFKGPKLIMHTQADTTVVQSHAQRLFDWASTPKEIVLFERGNHRNIIEANWVPYMDSLHRFVQNINARQT